MDYASLPHFYRKECSGSSRHAGDGYEKLLFLRPSISSTALQLQQALMHEPVEPIKQGSFHVDVLEGMRIAKTLESEFHKFGNGMFDLLHRLRIDDK
ncbi:hypothetical protein FH972_020065 [Carpinus fangiana]|uniref:Uncharacterized protein n=1 Tax=Carpinus fangiana TaxID=176857 RepID=A0A5N6RSK7_9ROSI|nr:hypothetical protein FH972_020065 [Carpinus fangiana]